MITLCLSLTFTFLRIIFYGFSSLLEQNSVRTEEGGGEMPKAMPRTWWADFEIAVNISQE